MSLTQTQLTELPDVETCILALGRGDTDYMEPLYHQTSSAVFGFAISILKDRGHAEDVMQDTYIKIYEAAHTYRKTGKPLPWVFGITRNLSLMKLRSDKRLTTLPDEATLDAVMSDTAPLTYEETGLLTSLFGQLATDEQQIIILSQLVGLKHREIADLLEMPLSTVLSRYRRALKKLERRYTEPLALFKEEPLS